MYPSLRYIQNTFKIHLRYNVLTLRYMTHKIHSRYIHVRYIGIHSRIRISSPTCGVAGALGCARGRLLGRGRCLGRCLGTCLSCLGRCLSSLSSSRLPPFFSSYFLLGWGLLVGFFVVISRRPAHISQSRSHEARDGAGTGICSFIPTITPDVLSREYAVNRFLPVSNPVTN